MDVNQNARTLYQILRSGTHQALQYRHVLELARQASEEARAVAPSLAPLSPSGKEAFVHADNDQDWEGRELDQEHIRGVQAPR